MIGSNVRYAKHKIMTTKIRFGMLLNGEAWRKATKTTADRAVATKILAEVRKAGPV